MRGERAGRKAASKHATFAIQKAKTELPGLNRHNRADATFLMPKVASSRVL